MDRPIIESRLDTDEYKPRMNQLIWRHYRDVETEWALTNRTGGVRLVDYVDIGELKENLDHIRDLKLSQREIDFMVRNGYDPNYVDFFGSYRYPDYDLSTIKDGQFDLRFGGKWSENSNWETQALAIIDELYIRGVLKEKGITEQEAWHTGFQRLNAKRDDLIRAGILKKIVEFGTRRRFSRLWQRQVVAHLLRTAPDLLAGTSNLALAMEFDIPAIGTNAHELPMGFSGIYDDGTDESLLRSVDEVLDQWWDEYGFDKSVALPDTYGSESFFREFGYERALKWKGMRHDSGPANQFAEKLINYYQRLGIDPTIKQCVFSDGLKADVIIALNKQFTHRITDLYGWGTNLTNDCGIKALSLVIKLIKSCGKWTTKLTDNLNKGIGPRLVQKRYARAHKYTNTFTEECQV